MTIELGDYVKLKNLANNPLGIDRKKYYQVKEIFLYKGKIMFTLMVLTKNGEAPLSVLLKNIKEVKRISNID